jgi:hypothetical protein
MQVHLITCRRVLLTVLTLPSLAAAQGVWTTSQLYDRQYNPIATSCTSQRPIVQTVSSTSVSCNYNGGTFSGAARARFGGELGSQASFSLNSGMPLAPFTGVTMEARAILFDVLRAPGAASAHFSYHLDGSIAIEADAASPSSEAFTSRLWLGVSPPDPTEGWSAYLSFTNSEIIPGGPAAYKGYYDGYAGYTPGYTKVTHVDGDAIFNLALKNGTLPFDLSLISEASIWNYTSSPNVATGNSTTDFFHTVLLSGLQLFDDAGNDITATTPYSFDSGARVPISTAPEPATAVFLLTGLAAMWGASRRRSPSRTASGLNDP